MANPPVSVHSPLGARASRPLKWRLRWPRSQEKIGGVNTYIRHCAGKIFRPPFWQKGQSRDPNFKQATLTFNLHFRSYKLTNRIFLKAAFTAAALSFASAAFAAAWEGKWVNNNNTLSPGTTIQSIAANANKNAYTSNPALNNNAWGMQGTWLSFNVPTATDVLVSATSATTNAPGFTVYRTSAPFTGVVTGSTPDNFTNGAIHGFDQIAQAGMAGIVWATDATVTNSLPGNTTTNGIVETLGYVNASGISYTNAYGDRVKAGADDLSIDNLYESGVFGSAYTSGSTVYANLTLIGLAPGNYTIFVGGTMTSGTNTPIDVKVTGLPLSSSDCVFNWAEKNYASLFSPAGASSQTQTSYYYRYYTGTKSYMGVNSTDNHVYYLSTAGGNPQDVGPLTDYMKKAGCN